LAVDVDGELPVCDGDESHRAFVPDTIRRQPDDRTKAKRFDSGARNIFYHFDYRFHTPPPIAGILPLQSGAIHDRQIIRRSIGEKGIWVFELQPGEIATDMTSW
jgi:hypothetical protein